MNNFKGFLEGSGRWLADYMLDNEFEDVSRELKISHSTVFANI